MGQAVLGRLGEVVEIDERFDGRHVPSGGLHTQLLVRRTVVRKITAGCRIQEALELFGREGSLDDALGVDGSEDFAEGKRKREGIRKRAKDRTRERCKRDHIRRILSGIGKDDIRSS